MKNRRTIVRGRVFGFIPPPLADPIVTAIFQDAASGGLAMKGLLNASLADSGDKLISDIVSVTPQKIHADTGERGYRIDVEALTDDGEVVLFDVQMSYFKTMNERSVIYSQQSLSGGAKRGDKLTEVTAQIPRVIVLNILDFVLRPSGKNFHQVVELAYREEPREKAMGKYEIHHLQLPKFRELTPDLTKPLHCWLTAICRAQDQKTFMKDVVDMDAALQTFYKADPGFAQFVDRHGYVASLPEVRKEYRDWQAAQISRSEEDASILSDGIAIGEERGRAEGIAIGEERGRAEGIAIGEERALARLNMEIAIKSFREARSPYDLERIAERLAYLGVPQKAIEAARDQVKRELTQAGRLRHRSEHER